MNNWYNTEHLIRAPPTLQTGLNAECFPTDGFSLSGPVAHMAIFFISSKGGSFLGYLDLYSFEEYWSVIVCDVPQPVWYFYMITLKTYIFGSASYQEIHDVDISYLYIDSDANFGLLVNEESVGLLCCV